MKVKVLEEIDRGTSVSVAMTQAADLIILRSESSTVGEYWDIAHALPLSEEGAAELAYQEEQIFQRLRLRFIDMTLESETHDYPNSHFPGSERFVFIRACPKAVVQ
ncbi:hypothetical protein ACIRBX_11885 [Kitasatospora sp. NPDC096147]|uniref:hypothetical protein n=1 Tax=Kitasatospora sp. NPDC096147 TaxID=3364093 RepID=UPI00382EF0DD